MPPASLNLKPSFDLSQPTTSEKVEHKGKEILCYCTDLQYCKNETCSVVGGQCFHAIRSVEVSRGKLEKHHFFGCAPPEDDRSQLTCHGHLSSHKFRVPANISCCDNKNLCNLDLKAELHIPASPDQNLVPYILTVCILGGILLLMAVVVLSIYKKTKALKRKQWIEKLNKPLLANGGVKKGLNDGSLSWDFSLPTTDQNFHLNSPDISSGSGSGVPTLIQTTIGRQLEFVKSIGKGRYGEVWLAKWRGEQVAVKKFFTTEEDSWENEKEIYQSVMLRHDNVLGFIAADIRGHLSVTEMLLVTDYHPWGSLYDFLKRETPIRPQTGLLLAASAASGLSHLHMEFRGTQEKSAIAHRDIKSKNILVKRNGECAIADFGLAVRKHRDSGEAVVRRNNRVGTKRYMSPEVLSNTLNSRDFNGYTQADIYAFGLVLWEISRRMEEGPADQDVTPPGQMDGPQVVTSDRRTPPLAQGQPPRMNTISDDSGVSNGTDGSLVSVGRRRAASFSQLMTSSGEETSGSAPGVAMKALASMRREMSPKRPKSRAALPYLCPFGDLVPNDPSFDQMRQIVCMEKLRPPLDEEWFISEHLKAFVRTIQECWRESPGARVNALRVRKALKALYEFEQKRAVFG